MTYKIELIVLSYIIFDWPSTYPIGPQASYPSGYASAPAAAFNFASTASQGYYPYQTDFYHPYAQSTAYQYPPMFGGLSSDVHRSTLWPEMLLFGELWVISYNYCNYCHVVVFILRTLLKYFVSECLIDDLSFKHIVLLLKTNYCNCFFIAIYLLLFSFKLLNFTAIGEYFDGETIGKCLEI